MRVSIVIKAAMRAISPSSYAKTNNTQWRENVKMVNEFVEVHRALDQHDRILDIGSGSGETSTAMAKGELGYLGKPGEVVGVDISEDMTQYSRSQIPEDTTNISFHTLDVQQPSDVSEFSQKFKNQFSVVFSFHTLHWVRDQPALMRMVNKVLMDKGKFAFICCGGENLDNPRRQIFEEMVTEKKWIDFKEKKFPFYGTLHTSDSWMSRNDDQGYGPILQEDLKNLMKKEGFRVEVAKSYQVDSTLSLEFVNSVYMKNFLNSFPEFAEKPQILNEFQQEYIERVRAASIIQDGYVRENHEVVFLTGEKMF